MHSSRLVWALESPVSWIKDFHKVYLGGEGEVQGHNHSNRFSGLRTRTGEFFFAIFDNISFVILSENVTSSNCFKISTICPFKNHKHMHACHRYIKCSVNWVICSKKSFTRSSRWMTLGWRVLSHWKLTRWGLYPLLKLLFFKF